MTTPDERKRNRIWGRDMLDELSEDAALAPDLRAAATDLAERYPDRCALEGNSGLAPWNLAPEDAAIAEARILFQRVRESPACSPERQYALLVILRHL